MDDKLTIELGVKFDELEVEKARKNLQKKLERITPKITPISPKQQEFMNIADSLGLRKLNAIRNQLAFQGFSKTKEMQPWEIVATQQSLINDKRILAEEKKRTAESVKRSSIAGRTYNTLGRALGMGRLSGTARGLGLGGLGISSAILAYLATSVARKSVKTAENNLNSSLLTNSSREDFASLTSFFASKKIPISDMQKLLVQYQAFTGRVGAKASDLLPSLLKDLNNPNVSYQSFAKTTGVAPATLKRLRELNAGEISSFLKNSEGVLKISNKDFENIERLNTAFAYLGDVSEKVTLKIGSALGGLIGRFFGGSEKDGLAKAEKIAKDDFKFDMSLSDRLKASANYKEEAPVINVTNNINVSTDSEASGDAIAGKILESIESELNDFRSNFFVKKAVIY